MLWRLERVEAFADRTTQAKPVLDARGLTLQDARLTGTVKVCYRADEWAQPLAEAGDSAAGEYTLNAKLDASDEVGTYQGTYGVEWFATATLGRP